MNLLFQHSWRRNAISKIFGLASLSLSLVLPVIVRGDELKAYRCGAAEGERAVMTIVLSAEWSYESAAQSRLRVQKFVFTHSSGPFPYLWAEIETSSEQTLELRRSQAAEHPSRNLLSGGTTGETYYDSGRRALWSRTKDDHGTAGVTVTVFETHVATLRFFDRRADLADLEPKIIASVDNLRLHAFEEDLLASTEVVDIPDGVDTAAFRRKSITGGFPYLLCLTTITVIGGLATVERRIRRKRYEAQIAEVEKAQAERKAQTVKRESRENSAAADYLQAAAKRPHLRRE